QINNLARRYKRAAADETRSSPLNVRSRHSCANSTRCLTVYILGGKSSALAVDFMLGRGQRDSRARASKWGGSVLQSSTEVVQRFTADIEEAYARAPASAVIGLLQDPVLHFEMNDLLCAHKYVMEHNLCEWISCQNVQQGVAPSREHVLAQATAYFQWLNFAIGEAPPGREPLILNMDETSICRHVGGLRGTIVQ
ncbi:unnamed protein product, partial [Symbiodinium sp. KB8]